MLIDLHVHTTRFSNCARSTPDEMVARAQELGLDGLVLTEHHIVWPADELTALQDRFPRVRLFRGVEITIETGDDLLVYGPPHGELFSPRMPADELLRRAHDVGCVAVLAHPYRYADTVPDVVLEGKVEGQEVLSHHILNHAADRAATLACQTGAWVTAASDAHHTSMLGHYALDFEDPIDDEVALAAALQARRYRLYIDRDMVAAENAWLARHVERIRALIAAGRTDREIRDEIPELGGTTLRGIREGRDVFMSEYAPTCG